MADEQPLDPIAAEEADIAAELARVKAADPLAPPQDTAGDVIPTEPAAPPAPVPAAADAKPPEPIAAEPDKKPDGEPWKRLREKDREVKELQRRFDELATKFEAIAKPTKPADGPAKEPTFDEDPAINLLHRSETAEQRIARIEIEQSRARELDTIRTQEQLYSKDHPDYNEAVNHLVLSDLADFHLAGQAAKVAELNQALMNDHPVVKTWVRAITSAQDVTEDEALKRIADASWIEERRQLLVKTANTTGRPVPELAYELAQRRGYAPKGAAPAAPVAPAAPKPDAAEAARARVQHAKEVSRGGQTLSEMNTTPAPEQRRFTRAQIHQMTEEEIDFMNETNPGWYKEA